MSPNRRTRRSFRLPQSALLGATVVMFGCSDPGTGLTSAEREVSGRVLSPAAGSLSGLTATWRSGSQVEVVPVSADGTFSVRITSDGSRGELLIDSPPPRRFHPFLYSLHPDSARGLAVVLVPREWTIRKGSYAGETVPISLDLVMDDLVSPTYFNVRPWTDTISLGIEASAWREENFPAKVAIDHRNASQPITPADSAALWAVWNRMEEILGMNLFEPIPADPSWWPSMQARPIPGVIRVTRAPGVIAAALALSTNQPAVWHQQLAEGLGGGGRFNAFRLSRLWINSGHFVLGEAQQEPPMTWPVVYAHEMLHVLGVGHTCKIPSPQGPCLRTPFPSRHDVAYLELLRAIMHLEEVNQTFLGLVPATIGERRVELGLPALPTLLPR